MAPHVGIVMGSVSDLHIMAGAAKKLKDFGVSHEVLIISAHRTPDLLFDYASKAEERGLQVIIAGAGGAAHLPGMVAAKTSVPVIGVPISHKPLLGLDPLLAIVQMPYGVPVLVVGIDMAENAAIAAAQIIGTSDPHIRARVKEFRLNQEKEVLLKAKRLAQEGYEKYLQDM